MSFKGYAALAVLAAVGGALIGAARVDSKSTTSATRGTATEPRSRPAGTAATSRAAWPDERLIAACRARLDGLRRDTRGALSYRLDAPFVIAGDLSDDELDRIARHTVRAAAEALWRQYFSVKPSEPITILLFAGKRSYEQYAKQLFNDKTVPHFGYYRPNGRTLVMNIGTGTGTLVHEMVHALAAFDFPNMPDWFSEGLASLYEQCTLAGGDIRGLVNWRLPDLQEAIRAGTLRSLKDLATADDFRGRLEGLNYAQARYFCMYMQEKGVLRAFYRRFRDGVASDPTGLQFVEAVFAGRPIGEVERGFLRWVSTLRWE